MTEHDDIEIDLGELPTEDAEVEIDLSPIGEEDEPAEEVISLTDDEEAAEEPEASEEADDAAQQAIAALREDLEGRYGEWYVIHTYSGMENRVKQNLDSRATSLNMEDYIFETIVPTEDVVEVRNNTRKTVTRCVLPGYVLVRMEMTDDSWAVVRHTPSVTGFVGHGQTPVPLNLDEVVSMLTPSVVAKVAAESTGPAKSVKKKVEVVDFAVGDSVQVIDGPFAGVHATITEINANHQRLRALVEIMGRETPLDLEFKQVEKVV